MISILAALLAAALSVAAADGSLTEDEPIVGAAASFARTAVGMQPGCGTPEGWSFNRTSSGEVQIIAVGVGCERAVIFWMREDGSFVAEVPAVP